MLKIGGHCGRVGRVERRSTHLTDGIAREREQLGYGSSVAVCPNSVYHITGFVVNLEYRALQQRTSKQAVGGIVVGRLLHDLDLTAYRRVRPFNFCRGAVAEVNRFQLRVEHITVRRFDLTEIVAASPSSA